MICPITLSLQEILCLSGCCTKQRETLRGPLRYIGAVTNVAGILHNEAEAISIFFDRNQHRRTRRAFGTLKDNPATQRLRNHDNLITIDVATLLARTHIGKCATQGLHSLTRRAVKHTTSMPISQFIVRTKLSCINVDYELTALGREILVPVTALAMWAFSRRGEVEAARASFDSQTGTSNPPT